MRYYLGMDVGGTKTHCLVADETGKILGFGSSGPGNYETDGVEAAYRENKAAVDSALSEAQLTLEEIGGVGLGVAGADLPEDYEMLEREIYTPLFGGISRVFRNDSMAGLRGGTRQPYGIVIVCGTGSVCAGKSPGGDETRVGGLGEKFGDKVTGPSLGEAGLQAVWRARDGIIGATLLTEKFVVRSGCEDVDALFQSVYGGTLTRADLYPMAQVVAEAAVDGDSIACDILKDGGGYLAAMVNAVAKKLDMTLREFNVVAVGGAFKDVSGILFGSMAEAIRTVCPHAETVTPAFAPVVGALLMAYELDTVVTDEMYNVISRNLSSAENCYHIQLKVG